MLFFGAQLLLQTDLKNSTCKNNFSVPQTVPYFLSKP
nr:MAG TPA: hypothetical protein [Caudoviricetes sp.]